jgi:hypothetical protein
MSDIYGLNPGKKAQGELEDACEDIASHSGRSLTAYWENGFDGFWSMATVSKEPNCLGVKEWPYGRRVCRRIHDASCTKF